MTDKKKPALPTREKEYTPEVVQGGSYDEAGKLVHQTKREPDAQRTKKPER